MKEKKLKILKILKTLFRISLIVSLFVINDIYAKYFEEIDLNYQTDIKKWKIVLNDKAIRSGNFINEVQIQTKTDPSEYAAADVLVPGRDGYLDLELDFSEVGVPFKSDFYVEQLEESENYKSLPDFLFYGFQVLKTDRTEYGYYYELPEEYQQLKKITVEEGTLELKTEPYFEEDLLLVPCYKTEGEGENKVETVGMYDMITGKFFTDLGTGTYSYEEEDIVNGFIVDPSEWNDNDKKLSIKAYIRWIDVNDETITNRIDKVTANNTLDVNIVNTIIGNITNTRIDYLNNIDDISYFKDITKDDEISNTIMYKLTATFEQYITNTTNTSE